MDMDGKGVESTLSLTQCDLLDNSDDVGIAVRFPRSRRDWLEPLFFPSFPRSSTRVVVSLEGTLRGGFAGWSDCGDAWL